ncbi:MAG TPA: protein kinase, partial [Thermoanaerobaculia bacterium]|nr:protein kinase [Thermoanaerobaculia bacterium]
MSLSAGTRLGPYELLGPIGAGGMGEVYRAKDTRLERTVAVKVLSSHLAASAESRQRFEREARTISQLSHAHICALYDVGREGETEYLVMEYLEGETLSDRLLKGALPFEQLLRYGVEISDALDKAHRSGIVHRDLKPGNVMLTKSGVKLLDFGLAKAIAPTGLTSGAALTALPTQHGSNLTQEGTILGTFQYMAPEQLEGKEADARTDIFAFGCVLYEMATGRKAFSGASQASLISSIMGSEPPPISTVVPMTPPAFDRVVRTCLAKDPDDRWQTAHDVGMQLKWIQEGGSAAGLPTPVAAGWKSRERLAWGIAVLLAFGTIGALLAAARYRRAAVEVGPIRSSILPPPKAAFRLLGSSGGIAVSPDGRRLTYSASGPDGKIVLWLRPLDATAEQPLAGTDGASYPFWSPDSRFIGFFADGKLKKIDASGGPALALCEAVEGRGGTWQGDVILFAKRYSPILRVSASGGAVAEVTKLDPRGEHTTHRWPEFLPDCNRFLYLRSPIGSENERAAIFVGTLDGSDDRQLLAASSNPVYASGYLLYGRDYNLMAQPFDAKRARGTEEAAPIANNLQYDPVFSRAMFSASQNGVLVFQTGSLVTGSSLVWFDRAGREIGRLGDRQPYLGARLAPDYRRAALSYFDFRGGNEDIWIHDLARGVQTRFTFGANREGSPVWSPDGERLAYASNDGTQPAVLVKPTSGAGREEVLFRTGRPVHPTDWSLDGRFLAVELEATSSTSSKYDIWIVPM